MVLGITAQFTLRFSLIFVQIMCCSDHVLFKSCVVQIMCWPSFAAYVWTIDQVIPVINRRQYEWCSTTLSDVVLSLPRSNPGSDAKSFESLQNLH